MKDILLFETDISKLSKHYYHDEHSGMDKSVSVCPKGILEWIVPFDQNYSNNMKKKIIAFSGFLFFVVAMYGSLLASSVNYFFCSPER